MEPIAKTKVRYGIALCAAIIAALGLSACAFDPEPPIGYSDHSQKSAAAPRNTGSYYTVTVQSGDTLSRLAARHNVSMQAIISANRLRDQDRIYAGAVLRIPSQGRTDYAQNNDRRFAAAPRRSQSPPAQSRPVARQPQYVTTTAQPPSSNSDSNETLLNRAQAVIDRLGGADTKDTQYASYQPQTSRTEIARPSEPTVSSSATVRAGNGRFIWPVSGRVIAPFGTSSSGERNDGINIAAAHGTPIHAAASGVVTYSGNELKGYGNLALIKHDESYVTAYAHADRLTVGQGDKVIKGQVIGYTGQTGNVHEPQVHFEIRQNTKPVDPNPLLMAAR